MPLFQQGRKRPVSRTRDKISTTTSQRKGLNTFLLDSELDTEEARKLDNLKIVGKGILEPRDGTGTFFTADSSNTVRHIFDYYSEATDVQLMAITDSGYLVKQSGTSYIQINGASFASGARPESIQIYGKRYIVDGNTPLKRYDGTTLLSYTEISSPTSLTATKSSGTSGAFTYSYRVAHESNVGETLATDPFIISTLPSSLSTTKYVTLNWANGSPASQITGTVIFGRESGAETYMTRVPSSVTTWIDDGTIEPSLDIFPYETNTTDGPVAKHIRRYKEKILLGNLSDNRSIIQWSGSGTQFIDKFHYSKGGGYYAIEQDSEDRWGVTGLSEREGKFIVFKGTAIFQGTLEYNDTLGINEANVTKLIDGVGCISSGTILEVENSVMFVAYIAGRGLALAKLDYEPNILSSVLRFQPISARVQSIVDAGSVARVEDNFAIYFDKKYHWFIPVGTSSWQCLVYDVERTAFVGPWTLTNAWAGHVHLDADNKYHLLLGKSDGKVLELSSEYLTDEGTEFTWEYVSKEDDFKEPFRLKTVVDAKTHLKNVTGGTVEITYITRGKNGLQNSAKSVSIAPSTTLGGWGSFGYARSGSKWGYNPSTSTGNSADSYNYSLLNKANSLTVQTKIKGSGSRAQIIANEIRARPQAITNVPSSWRN